MVSKEALTGVWLAAQRPSRASRERVKAKLKWHQGALCSGTLPASLCTFFSSSLMAASPLPAGDGGQPSRSLLPAPTAISQSELGSSRAKTERPGLDPVPTLDQSPEARGVVQGKTMVTFRPLGGPQWRGRKNHCPLIRQPGTGSLESLPLWGHVQ